MKIVKKLTELGMTVGYTVTVCVFHGDVDYRENIELFIDDDATLIAFYKLCTKILWRHTEREYPDDITTLVNDEDMCCDPDDEEYYYKNIIQRISESQDMLTYDELEILANLFMSKITWPRDCYWEDYLAAYDSMEITYFDGANMYSVEIVDD